MLRSVEEGKLYESLATRIVVKALETCKDASFKGVIVKQSDNDLRKVGTISNHWTTQIFKEYEGNDTFEDVLPNTKPLSIGQAPPFEVEMKIENIINGVYNNYPSVQNISFSRSGMIHISMEGTESFEGASVKTNTTKGFNTFDTALRYLEDKKFWD